VTARTASAAETSDDLKARLRAAGVTQTKLAQALGVTHAFVSQVLAGKRPWPPGKRQAAEDYLAARPGGAA